MSTFCRQLKLTAADGKQYSTDCLTQKGVDSVLLILPGKYRIGFADWIEGMASLLDERSKQRVCELWDSPILDNKLVGTVEGLRQVHAFLFDGLYDFAAQIRAKNISKGGFQFANCVFFRRYSPLDRRPSGLDCRADRRQVRRDEHRHPFMEGNGRATRIWLDMLLKKRLGKCVDWRLVAKKECLAAMEKSVVDSSRIHALVVAALTDDIDSRELFMKGIDYSYYYEVVDE